MEFRNNTIRNVKLWRDPRKSYQKFSKWTIIQQWLISLANRINHLRRLQTLISKIREDTQCKTTQETEYSRSMSHHLLLHFLRTMKINQALGIHHQSESNVCNQRISNNDHQRGKRIWGTEERSDLNKKMTNWWKMICPKSHPQTTDREQ